MIQTIDIRAARAEDAEGIVALLSLPGYRAGTLRLPYPDPAETRKRLENRQPDAFLIVAVSDGRVLGSAG